MCRTRFTTHCPTTVRQCIGGDPLPTAKRQGGTILRESHCPLPRGIAVVYGRSSTAHCPTAVWQEFHNPLTHGIVAVYRRSLTTHYL